MAALAKRGLVASAAMVSFICAPASGQGPSVNDVLSMEDIGGVVAYPDGHAFLYERIPALSMAPNLGALYSGVDRRPTGKIYRKLVGTNGRGVLAFPQKPEAGYWVISTSPSGRRVAIIELVGETAKLIIFDLVTNLATRFDASPNFGWHTARPAWIGEEKLVLSVAQASPPSGLYRRGAINSVQSLWQRSLLGRQPSVTLMSTTSKSPVSQEMALAVVDLRSSSISLIATGDFADIALSPDGQYALGLRRRELANPSYPRGPAEWDPSGWEPVLAKINGELAAEPLCRDCLIQRGTISWDEDSSQIKFTVFYDQTQKVFDGVYRIEDAVLREAQGTRSAGSRSTGSNGTGKEIVGSRSTIVEIDDQQMKADPYWHRVYRNGGSDYIFSEIGGRQVGYRRPSGTTSLAAINDKIALYRGDDNGVVNIASVSVSGEAREELTLNEFMSNRIAPRLTQYDHVLETGYARSCLVEPLSNVKSAIVVSFYPAIGWGACRSHGRVMPGDFQSNEVFTGSGYRVLYVGYQGSMYSYGEKWRLAACNALQVAIQPYSRDDLTLLGISQGFYPALQCLVDRPALFSKAILGFGMSNPLSQYGSIPLSGRVLDEYAQIGDWTRMNAKSYSARFKSNPWTSESDTFSQMPLGKLANVQASVLILQSDLDPFSLGQADELFTGLYVNKKRAVMATYWGEAHGPLSPANIVDYWARVRAWIEGTEISAQDNVSASLPTGND